MSIDTNNFSLEDASSWYDKFINECTDINDKTYENKSVAEKWRLNTEHISKQHPQDLVEYIQGLYYAMYLLGDAYVLATRQLAAETIDEFSEDTIEDLAADIADEFIDKAYVTMLEAEKKRQKAVKPKSTPLTDATDMTSGLSDEQLAILKKIVESEELKRWKEKNGKKEL